MMLWTKRHTIPVVFDEYSYALSTVLDGKIWTVCDNRSTNGVCNQKRLYVFDPVFEIFTEINCIYPAVWPDELLEFITDGSDLYIWREPDTWSRIDRSMYKLNRATLEWEQIMNIRTENTYTIWLSMVVIEQMMYILEVDPVSMNSLITIDLSKKEVIQRQILESLNQSWYKCLATNNNNLYLMDCHKVVRKVSEVINGELIEVAREELSDNDRSHREHVHCADSNEFVRLEHGDQTFELRAFDFETLKWETLKSTWAISYQNSAIKSAMKVNGSLYILKPTNVDGGVQCEFHELDLHPTLQSICLADLTSRLFEEIIDELKVEEMKQQVPLQMREKLDELIKWRIEAAVIE